MINFKKQKNHIYICIKYFRGQNIVRYKIVQRKSGIDYRL